MLLVISWLMYVVCFVLAIVWPTQTSLLVLRAMMKKQYVAICVAMVLSIACMVVMMHEYGVWCMIGVQVLGSVLCSIRSYWHERQTGAISSAVYDIMGKMHNMDDMSV